MYRLRLKIKPTREIPYNNQHELSAQIHKWTDFKYKELLGKEIPLSFSRILGEDKTLSKTGVAFKDFCYWHISTPFSTIRDDIMDGIQKSPFLFDEFDIVKINSFEIAGDYDILYPSSDIMLTYLTDGGNKRTKTWQDDGANELLLSSAKRHLSNAGVSSEGLDLIFDVDSDHKKFKTSSYRHWRYYTSVCPIKVLNASEEQVLTLRATGIGNGTQIGFGSLY